MYERFTDRARKVMQLANQEATRYSHEYIGTEHILLGLLKEGSGVAINVIKNLNIDLHRIRLEVENLVGTSSEIGTPGKKSKTPQTKKLIDGALKEASDNRFNYVGTEHLLLGIFHTEGIARDVLDKLGLSLEAVRQEIFSILGWQSDVAAAQELDQFIYRFGKEGPSKAETEEERIKQNLTQLGAVMFNGLTIVTAAGALAVLRREMDSAKAAGKMEVACALLKCIKEIEGQK